MSDVKLRRNTKTAKQSTRRISYPVLLMYIICVINLSTLVILSNQLYDIKQSIKVMEEYQKDHNTINKKMEGILNDISVNLDKEPTPKDITIKKNNSINNTTDLKLTAKYTVEDMNKIINEWDKHVKNGTPFKDQGHVFVKAAEETGLNPIYILAHAAWESGWGNSHIARDKGNYFGINAVDRSSYHSAYSMGSTLEEGIISGAIWIKNNYYNKGKTDLNKMIYGGKAYASDKDKWISGIISIANTSIRML